MSDQIPPQGEPPKSLREERRAAETVALNRDQLQAMQAQTAADTTAAAQQAPEPHAAAPQTPAPPAPAPQVAASPAQQWSAPVPPASPTASGSVNPVLIVVLVIAALAVVGLLIAVL